MAIYDQNPQDKMRKHAVVPAGEQKAPQDEGAKASPAAWDTRKTSLAPVVCRSPHLEGKSAEEIPGKKDVNPYSHAGLMTFFEGRTHLPMFVPPIQRKEGS